MKNWKYIEGSKTGNSSYTKEEAKTKDEYFKILKFYQTQGYKTKAGESNPNGSIKLHKGDDSVEIVLVGNTKAGNYSKDELLKYAKMYGDKELIDHINSGKMTSSELGARIRWFQYQWDGKDINGKIVDKSKTGNEDKTGAEEFFKHLSDDVKEREKKDDADIEKVGNFKTGKSALKPGDRVQSYGVQGTVRKVEGENSDNIYGEPIIEVEWDNGTVKKVGEHYLRKIGNKVGNAKDKNDKDLKVGDIVDVRGKKGKITKIIGDVIEVFYDNSGTYNPDRIDRHYADEAIKVGNSKIGNEASDDKFAYVMREFDEGKLKTPDGKVVTDPAQAKAIAYSESKKTENGLARARNAMNKKCGNAQITLWKGNDTVLISENGLVQYLESNSFEVDRDKYDSQEQAIEELTKKGYRKK